MLDIVPSVYCCEMDLYAMKVPVTEDTLLLTANGCHLFGLPNRKNGDKNLL